MAYTTVTSGTAITASWGNSVRDQQISTFASASARSAAVTSPVEGMVTYLEDNNDFWYYNGSAHTLISQPVFARRTSDGTAVNNSTTLVNDSSIALAVVASAVYVLNGRLVYTSDSTPDFKFGWTYPTGLTMDYAVHGIAAATASYGVYTNSQTDTPALEGAGSATKREALLQGLVVVSSTAGTLQLQTAQNTANVSNTVLKSGSYVILTRVA